MTTTDSLAREASTPKPVDERVRAIPRWQRVLAKPELGSLTGVVIVFLFFGIVAGDSGILIRGASGAGKSSLATLIVAQTRACGLFARWVGDRTEMLLRRRAELRDLLTVRRASPARSSLRCARLRA